MSELQQIKNAILPDESLLVRVIALDAESAKQLSRKMQKGSFDFNDYLVQVSVSPLELDWGDR